MKNSSSTFNFSIRYFTGAVVACMLLFYFYIWLFAGPKTDPFYNRFTSKRQESLILGSSRAAQGIIPNTINKNIGSNLFNYSFTLNNSPYGPIYNNSILRKLSEQERNDSFFILEVNPWSLSTNRTNETDNPEKFIENNLFLDKMKFVNSKPNIEYVLKCYKRPYYSILYNYIIPNSMYLHADGWLEINIDMTEPEVARRKFAKLSSYLKKLNRSKLSESRIDYLRILISKLKGYGKVSLVRLPVSPELLNIEEKYAPNFDHLMNEIASDYNVNFINLKSLSPQVMTTDGNHLYKESGEFISGILADSLKKL
ncbi:hypothetical protein [Ekhidna sp.]|uniref:hypothetical protein n=1 Tax=Ekhidna sp. TaxID=2608089 RepID=UPI003CCBE4C1